MDRVRYPSGSEVKFEDLVDDIQNKAFANLKKRVAEVIGSYGLNLTVTNGVIPAGTDFSVATTNLGADVSVEPGSALTDNGNYIKTTAQRTATNLADSNANNGYAVVLTYSETGSSPVKSVNAFVFDKLGSQSLNRNRVFSDSVTVSLVEITSDLSTLKASLTTDQIIIAAI